MSRYGKRIQHFKIRLHDRLGINLDRKVLNQILFQLDPSIPVSSDFTEHASLVEIQDQRFFVVYNKKDSIPITCLRLQWRFRWIEKLEQMKEE